jgi:DNA 3'-phosphatase
MMHLISVVFSWCFSQTKNLSLTDLLFFSPIPIRPQHLQKVKGAIDMVVAKAQVPMDALLATGSDQFRKPDTGMWRHYLELVHKKQQHLHPKTTTNTSSTSTNSSSSSGGGIPSSSSSSVDLSACFFVGDAAGRAGDHSDSDKLFAVTFAVGESRL